MTTAEKGIMEYLPLINLGATVVGMIGAFLVLKLALAAFQTSVGELKDDLRGLADGMRKEFAEFGEKLGALDKRITVVETVGAMLGRKPTP